MKLIHYSSTKFDRSRFTVIKNRALFNKPSGGLWTSPIDSKWGWKDWCIGEHFNIDKLNKFFIIELKKDSKILKINSLDDLKKVPLQNLDDRVKNYPELKDVFYSMNFPNYEKISKEYDAIHLTERGQYETRLPPFGEPNLYGWDCETVLVMNPNCIILTKSEKLDGINI